MATIGQKLGEARREAGLSVDVIAHEIRIHPKMIRSIEDDDFSMFPSVAYARSFVAQYADVLGIDLRDSLRALNSGVTIQLGENELMGEMKKTIRKDRYFRKKRFPHRKGGRPSRRGSRPLLLNLILILLMAAMAIFYFLGFHAPNVDMARENITTGIQEANPFSEATPEEPIPENPLRARPIADADGGVSPESAARTRPESSRGRLTYVDGDIEKPEVDLEMEEERPRPAERVREAGPDGVSPRKTPDLPLEQAMPEGPISTSDLPALQDSPDEPVATLRPEGTDPVEETESPASDEDRDSASVDDRDLRAVPVARSE